ncbi:MAG: TonB-dependent receptor plug domain-containing protein [Spirochaetota bacterium]
MIPVKIKITSILIFSILIFNASAEEQNTVPIFNLGEITVKERVPSNIEESTGTSIIKREDIILRSDRTLDDSLKNIPGLQVGTHRKGHMRASIRGFDQKQITILIDGIPVNDVYSTDIDISDISVSEIEEIIVSRGAASALYGTSGGVGIINIITRKPSFPYAEARASYGEHNSFSINASAGAPLGNFFFNTAAEYSRSNGYAVSKKLNKKKRREWFDKFVRYDLYNLEFEDLNMPAVESYINDSGKWNHTEHRKYGFSGRLGYNIDINNEAGITADYSYKEALTNSYQHNAISDFKNNATSWGDPLFDISSNPMDIKKAAFRNRSFVWPQIHNTSLSPYINLTFKNIKIKGNTFVTYKNAKQEKYASNDHTWPGDTTLADTALEPFLSKKEYLSWGGNLYPTVVISKINTVNFALLYRYDIYNESEQALSAEKSPATAATIFGLDPYPVKRLDASQFTAAVENETKLGRLNFTLGVSYDTQFFHTFKNREALYQYENAYIVKNNPGLLGTRDSINPVAGLTFDILDEIILFRAAGSMKTRFPDLSEYSMIVDDKRDNALKPEKMRNFSTGFEFSQPDKNNSIRIDYFISNAKNRIEKISGGIDPPVNLGKVESQGIETIITGELKDIFSFVNISMTLSYTYLHTRNHDNTPEEKVNKGKYLEYTPVHQICADIRARFKTGTTLTIWGYSTINQIAYAMKERPQPFPAETPFSTKYFEPVHLHNPVMLNVKIIQKLGENSEIYLLCKNLLDDYNTDPFIPEPGRTFYIGGGIEL